MANFMCCYCGSKTTNISSSPANCTKNPSKVHEWINIDGVKQFICSYCGVKVTNPHSHSGTNCNKSPHKKHKWMAG